MAQLMSTSVSNQLANNQQTHTVNIHVQISIAPINAKHPNCNGQFPYACTHLSVHTFCYFLCNSLLKSRR